MLMRADAAEAPLQPCFPPCSQSGRDAVRCSVAPVATQFAAAFLHPFLGTVQLSVHRTEPRVPLRISGPHCSSDGASQGHFSFEPNLPLLSSFWDCLVRWERTAWRPASDWRLIGVRPAVEGEVLPNHGNPSASSILAAHSDSQRSLHPCVRWCASRATAGQTAEYGPGVTKRVLTSHWPPLQGPARLLLPGLGRFVLGGAHRCFSS